jgi:polysaccharide deacetylase family protein (PEP-CTERM system associated)
VVRNTERLLELFQEYHASATWFVLGEVAEAFPGLVKRLAEAGQEIGIHGYHHHNVFDLSESEFRRSVRRAKEMVEQLTGRAALGYRATSFSIRKKQWWAFDVLAELGFRYDSSIFPIRGRRYGIPDAPLTAYTLATRHGPLQEVPLSVMELGRRRLPCCGGGYFRHFPRWYTQLALRHLERAGRPAVFYLHPYELDTQFAAAFFEQQVGRAAAGTLGRWRYLQYRNRARTVPKLQWLLARFAFDGIARVFGLDSRREGNEAAN